MRLEIEPGAPESVEADVLAAPLAVDAKLSGPAAALDERLDGALARLATDGEASGKLNSSALLHVDGALGSSRVALAGVGPRDAIDADALRTAAAAVVRGADFAGAVRVLAMTTAPSGATRRRSMSRPTSELSIARRGPIAITFD